ncbi:EpsG family protein [Flavobacterium segetis]|uniref:EpsG family protein n=1 Tax=Flavobacterium segetis TaxID=271157 RepID=A0A1M5IFP5_9FLAO|nr:EpsG family protein [Flavobacterium segetis]SHG27087.1 EpsG family protein [Flavobacterium segetis]
MSFYITIFIILCFFSFIEGQNLDRRITSYFYFLFCFFFFILSFIRWETGTDWKNYFEYFQNARNTLEENDPFEWGFGLLIRIVSFFTDNYSVFLFVAGLLLFAFQSMAIKKLSPYPIMSLLFLWSIQFANILFVRQWIAVVILAYSVKFVKNRKIFPFILLVILAASFHRTSLLFFLSWWIYNLKISKKKMIVILILSISFSVILAKVIEIVSGGLGSIVQAKIDMYLSADYNQETNEDLGLVSIIIKGFVNKFLILFTSFYFYDKINARHPQFKGYLNLYWFGAVIYFSTISISLVFVRFSYAFDFFQIILVPYLFRAIENNVLKVVIFLIFFLYLFLRMWQVLNGPYVEEFIPFKTIL